METSFFTKINYSACNEDSESERRALQLTHTDTVLCITGSGARPLDLLIDKPAKIISVDFNATQNYLLALKIAAYQTLTYAEFLVFIGMDEASHRAALYHKVTAQLSPAVKDWWDAHYALIARGLLYAGTWERLLRSLSKVAFFRTRQLQILMASPSLDSQKAYWNTHWDNTTWRLFLKLLSNRLLWTKVIQEPGALLIPQTFDIYAYMHTRLNHLAHTHLLRDNHFAHLLFYGQYQNTCLLPIHLRKEYFDTIRSQVDKIEIVTDSLGHVLDQKPIVQQITAYSLSDFSSYAAPAMYADIWTRIATHSQPGTRFCERQFLVKRSPEALHSAIKRNPELEAQLMQQDLTAIYSFCVGQIQSRI